MHNKWQKYLLAIKNGANLPLTTILFTNSFPSLPNSIIKMDHRYNLIKIGKEIVQTPEQAIEWAKRHGLLPTERKCRRCRQPMTLRTDRGIRSFRCRRCEGPQFALTDNTWFEGVNSKIMVAKGILLTYAFATKMSYEQAIRESTIMETGQITSEHTVSDWYSYCRECCTIHLDGLYENSGPMGGPGRVIEIDEMKLGRRKYERGRVVEGSWILGMIDQESSEIRLEICPENRRDSETLLRLIQKHVRPDSTLFTDCWRGYTHLGQNGFEHWCVNHQLQFVTEEGVTTNKIESQWRPLRQRLARGGVQAEKLADHLCEFLWRRDCLRREVDPFNELISTIRNQFPGH